MSRLEPAPTNEKKFSDDAHKERVCAMKAKRAREIDGWSLTREELRAIEKPIVHTEDRLEPAAMCGGVDFYYAPPVETFEDVSTRFADRKAAQPIPQTDSAQGDMTVIL